MMRNLPAVTKHLLLVTFLFWLLDLSLQRYGVSLSAWLGLHYLTAPGFYFWQPFTYMFMHADFTHIFCNMFAVLMFAPVLEREWGSRRFLFYYLVCGVGAAAVQEAVWALRIHSLLADWSLDVVMANYASRVVTIGASGAVFGILLAFGWLFPDVKMFLLFFPVPIRARVFVIIYAVIELMAGFSHISGDNVAHFAHLGGMFFGLLLLLWWKWRDGHWSGWRWPWRSSRRLDSTKDGDSSRSKDYSGYHYQSRIDD
jgi:membrane associated rhomboid family serine protease